MFHDLKINILLCLLLLISSFVFYKNYQNLQSSLQEQGVLVRGIKDGKNNYHVIQNKECIANLSFNIVNEQMLGLQTEVEFKNANLNGPLFFNPLGQFVGGRVRFQGHSSENKDLLFIELRGVKDLSLKLLGDFAGEKIKKQITIPGHFELRSDDTFSLVYPKINQYLAVDIVKRIDNLGLSVGDGHCQSLHSFKIGENNG